MNANNLDVLASVLGVTANQTAARHTFQDYRQRRSDQTLRRQQADLNLFASFLDDLGLHVANLWDSPQPWHQVTWGLVAAFVQWQLKQGYAVASVNVHLSTIKTYARLAFQAGAISTQEYALIRSVQGYSIREQHHLDSHRPIQRVGYKKSSALILTVNQAGALKKQPDTPQGRRDTLLMCLLLDHGLRAGEIALLGIENFDIANGLLRFFRPKVGKQQTHRLSGDTLAALKAYLQSKDASTDGPLLYCSKKNGALGKAGMTVRSISERVYTLARKIGVVGLSAHDCRHYWASRAAQLGADPFSLQEAGGWTSLAMPRRYVQERVISNDGIEI